jgi:23S rRNA (pseudouridine1915-N3)-methyltransferase
VDLVLAAISPSRKRPKSSPSAALVDEFLTRASRFSPCASQFFPTEQALVTWLERQSGRTPPKLILLDSRGKQFSSEEFAEHLSGLRDSGVQAVVLAVGPADGWSAEFRGRAHLILSLGRMTLPHEMARAVLAEQIYRALTILAGHPYHSGH